MTLLELYQTNPRALLQVTLDDFEEDQWHDLTQHLGSHQNDAYDPDVLQRLLPIIGHRVLWLTTTCAQQFLYTAIFHNDLQTVNFILDTFDNVRNGAGFIDGWDGYVASAVQDKINHNEWSYAVLDRLLQHFDDKQGGWGLLRAVQQNNIDMVRYILPHSDPSLNHFFAYRWAQVSHLNEIENFLEPLSNKLHALFGYHIEQWVEHEDRVEAQRVKDILHIQILNGLYDQEPLALLYRMGMKNGSIAPLDLTDVSNEDRIRLALLWRPTQQTLALDTLKTVETLHDNIYHSVAQNFRDHPDIVIPKMNKKQRQDELYNCVYNPHHYTFAQRLVEYGADPHKTLDELIEQNKLLAGIGTFENVRKTALDTLTEWISAWQAQTIHSELGALGGEHKPSKI